MRWYCRAEQAEQPSWKPDRTKIANPEDVGYQEHWGEHWGPVQYEHDSWNYPSKGYGDQGTPMPLPKVLYHATPFPDQILSEGFQTFEDPSQQVLGGHGTYVSLTTWDKAAAYAEGLRDAIRAARGELKEEDLPAFADKWGIPQDKMEEAIRQARHRKEQARFTAEGLREPPQEYVPLDVLTYAWISSDFPLFMNLHRTAQRLKGLDPEQVGILEVQIEQPVPWKSQINTTKEEMAGHYSYNPSEQEWRIFSPEMLANIKKVEA